MATGELRSRAGGTGADAAALETGVTNAGTNPEYAAIEGTEGVLDEQKREAQFSVGIQPGSDAKTPKDK